jgi:hypothetical protein
MARKKDLAGLATLAGLAYMATRDKGGEGSAPVEDRVGKAVAGDDQYNEDVKYGDMMSEKEPGWESGKATATPARRTPRAVAKPSAPGDDSYNPDVKQRLKDDQYNADAKQRTAPKLNILEEAKEEARRRRAGAMAAGEASRPTMEVGRLPKKGPGLSNFKSGGSVKGWGIARGARKAKTY